LLIFNSVAHAATTDNPVTLKVSPKEDKAQMATQRVN